MIPCDNHPDREGHPTGAAGHLCAEECLDDAIDRALARLENEPCATA